MNKFLQYGLFFLLLTASQLYGQEVQYYYPDETEITSGEDFVETPDGGYLIVGVKNSRIFINKIDANGAFQWEKFILDSDGGYYEFAKGIEPTDDGNYVLAVTTAVSPEEPAGMKLIKIDILGNILWKQSYYDINDSDYWGSFKAQDVIKTEDNGFVLTTNIKTIEKPEYSFQRGLVIRTDNEGNQLWEKQLPNGMDDGLGIVYDFGVADYFPEPLTILYSDYTGEHFATISSIYAIDSLMNSWDNHGDWVFNPEDSTLTGAHALSHYVYDRFVVFSNDPQVTVYHFYPNYENTVRLDILGAIETSSGNILVVGKQNHEAYAAMLDSQGEVIWEKTYVFSLIDDGASCVVETFDGHFVIGGSTSLFLLHQHRGLLFKIDQEGNVLWNTSTESESWESEAFAGVVETSSGTLIAGGHEEDFYYSNANAANSEPFIAAFLPDGTELWKQKDAQSGNGISVVSFVGDVRATSDSTYLMVGTELRVNHTTSESVWRSFLRTYGNLGYNINNLIQGQVYYDQNDNCSYETGEDSLGQWLVEITGNGQTVYTTSDIYGKYATLVDTGDYSIQLLPLNNYWEACPAQNVSFSQAFTSDTINLGAQSLVDCPYLEIDVSTPFVRRCFDNEYTVQYCNDGTVAAQDAYVEITLDEYYTYVSSSIPLADQTGQILRFDVGDLAIGECGSFSFVAYVDCDNTILGQTHCVEAHIYPDEICDPELGDTYAQIDIDAECQGDSLLVFTLRNVGTEDMSNPSEYVVIEDHVMYLDLSSDFDLNVGEEREVPITANGATYRLQAPQLPGTPYDAYVAATVEGCGTNEDGSFSIGMVTVYSENDEEPYLSIDCQENIGAYDPNDKHSSPKGFEEEHLIEKNTEIEYLIRFQNTGTDTAFYVEIVDTLSAHLDVSTIAPGASSHSYTWRLYDENVVKFIFQDIMLPDSFVNEAASNGFVKFKIQQQPDLPLGTRIENAADIYFDFNAPVRTPITFLTIGEQFIEVMSNINETEYAEMSVKVVPNPVQDWAHLLIEGVPFTKGNFELYDINGRLIHQQTFNSNKFGFYISDLAAGLYLYRIVLDDKVASSGKIVK